MTTKVNTSVHSIVIKFHDDQSEGLGRRAITSMVVTASGGKLSRTQAERSWDRTIYPFGKKLLLLTGYVKTQEGTSKRTAAGNVQLQRDWHAVITELHAKVKARAYVVLNDGRLVHAMLPALLMNLDEESVQANGKGERVVGSKVKKKHDNQNASSR